MLLKAVARQQLFRFGFFQRQSLKRVLVQVVSLGGGPKALAGGVRSAVPGGGATSASPPRGPHRILHNAWLLVAKANLESWAAGAGGSHSGQPATERDDTLTVTSWALCGGPGVALPKRHLVAPEPWGKLLKKGFRGWERLGKAVFSHPAFPSAVRSRKVMARGRSWNQIMFIFA